MSSSTQKSGHPLTPEELAYLKYDPVSTVARTQKGTLWVAPDGKLMTSDMTQEYCRKSAPAPSST